MVMKRCLLGAKLTLATLQSGANICPTRRVRSRQNLQGLGVYIDVLRSCLT
jgi:hypothetical protein